jgi:hypothetical protein
MLSNKHSWKFFSDIQLKKLAFWTVRTAIAWFNRLTVIQFDNVELILAFPVHLVVHANEEEVMSSLWILIEQITFYRFVIFQYVRLH